MSGLLRSGLRVLPITNRLFLYSVRLYPIQPARAAVATIGPYGFEAGTFSFLGDWTLVASAATAKRKWLLFHDSRTGAAATGWVDRSSLLQTVRHYPPGAIDFPFRMAAVDGRGNLMLLGFGTRGEALLGFAQVLDDGTFVEWWRTLRPDLLLPHGPIAGLKESHAWFSNDRNNAPGSTVSILDVKRGQILGQRRWGARIRWMVGEGDLLFFFFDDSLRTTELCVVDASYRIVTLKRTELDFATYTDGFNRIASSPGAHLLYSWETYNAPGAIRVLGRDGFRLTAQLNGIDWRWHYFVPC
jgi:hypothetical protein